MPSLAEAEAAADQAYERELQQIADARQVMRQLLETLQPLRQSKSVREAVGRLTESEMWLSRQMFDLDQARPRKREEADSDQEQGAAAS